MTLIRLRKDRAILGEEGSDMEEAAESAPFLFGGAGSGGERTLEAEGIPERVRGGSEGGMESWQPGELRLPLQ